jgi:hypothetical protein
VLALTRRQVLRAVGHDPYVRKPLGRPSQPVRLAPLALHQGHRHLGPGEREREAGEPGPAADVDDRPGVGHRRQRERRQAVGEVAVHPLLEPLDRRQVLVLEREPVEQGDERRGSGRPQDDPHLGAPRHEPRSGAGECLT